MSHRSATAITAIRRFLSPRKVPKPALGASFGAVVDLIGRSHALAYVDPYLGPRRRPRIGSDDDPGGSDPVG